MSNKAIFVGATGQNVGKTTLCLGMIAALKKRYANIGFIKPIGQRHTKIDGSTNVDKDAVLFKHHFQLCSAWSDMSPVIIPTGFTRSYLDQKVSEADMLVKIKSSFSTISAQNDYTIVEGTGHIGVGSIINMNNAQVAAKLGLDMIIIASGGLGSALDELALSLAICQDYGVKVKGIILNRVLEDKRDMIQHYFPQALTKWKIPLIGCIPFNEMLSNPSMKDYENLFATSLLSGKQHHYRNFQHFRLVAGSLDAYQAEVIPNQLVITPASREDIILSTLKKHQESLLHHGTDFMGGMILTSPQAPSESILNAIRKVDIPILYSPICSYDAMKMISTFTAKIRVHDTPKIERAIQLIEDHVDFDCICN